MYNKVKRINIFLTNKEKQQLTKIKNEYKLSFSTIIDIICYNFMQKPYCKNYIEKITKKTELKDRYKTSIKPKRQYEIPLKTTEMQNVVIWYLSQTETDKWPKKKLEQIDYDFINTYDANWNGNQLARFIPKFIKQNPDYCKKLMKVNE